MGLLGCKCCGKSLKCVRLDRTIILYPPHPLAFLLSLNTRSLLRIVPSAFFSGAYFSQPHSSYHWVGQVSSSFLLAVSSHSALKLPSFEDQLVSLQRPPLYWSSLPQTHKPQMTTLPSSYGS